MAGRISNPLKIKLLNKIYVIFNLLVSALLLVTFPKICDDLDEVGGSGK